MGHVISVHVTSNLWSLPLPSPPPPPLAEHTSSLRKQPSQTSPSLSPRAAPVQHKSSSGLCLSLTYCPHSNYHNLFNNEDILRPPYHSWASPLPNQLSPTDTIPPYPYITNATHIHVTTTSGPQQTPIATQNNPRT